MSGNVSRTTQVICVGQGEMKMEKQKNNQQFEEFTSGKVSGADGC
jgi:hypothetical protein